MNNSLANLHTVKKARGAGIRSILSFPQMFNFYQFIIGGNILRQKYVKEFIKPMSDAKILDIGCGTGLILDFLPNDISYTGYDLNQKYINYASKKYPSATFFCEEIKKTSIKTLGYFDIVLSGGVLHHLDDSESAKLFETAKSSLTNDGYLVTYDAAYTNNQSALAKFIISMDRGGHIRTPEEYSTLAKKHFKKVETTVLHDTLWIPYTILFMKCYK